MTELLLTRHGQATHNQSDRIVGRESTLLTRAGQYQARALACRLALWSPPIAHLYTSPQQRAQQTAEPIAHALKVQPILDDTGRTSRRTGTRGLTMDSFRQTMPEVYGRWEVRGDLSFQFPGGEQRLAVLQRSAHLLDEIVARHPGETVAVVSHGGTLRAGIGQNVLVTLNDCQHLHQE